MFCLSPFVGTGTADDPFRVDGASAIIDLRADATTVDGWALASVQTLPAGAVELGATLDDAPNRQTTRQVEDHLGVGPRDTLAGKTVRQIIEDLTVAHADAADPSRWNPVRAGRDGRLRIWLDGPVVDRPA